MNEVILSNQARCDNCGDSIFSAHRHDFVSCSCGSLSVDGGMDYIRRVFDDEAMFTEQSISMYDDAVKKVCLAIEDYLEAIDRPLTVGEDAHALSFMVTETVLVLNGWDIDYPQTEERNRVTLEQTVWAIEAGKNPLGILCAVCRALRDYGVNFKY